VTLKKVFRISMSHFAADYIQSTDLRSVTVEKQGRYRVYEYEGPVAEMENVKGTTAKGLIISEFSTSGLVRATSMETIQYGIRPIVAAEAVGDRDDYAHRGNLLDIERKYADVVPMGEIIRYLTSIKQT
jgi:isochorismate hydrolase